MMNEVKVFEDDKCCNRLEVTLYPCGSAEFHAENDWAGDTRTGFGAFASFTLDAAQITELIVWLTKHVTSK